MRHRTQHRTVCSQHNQGVPALRVSQRAQYSHVCVWPVMYGTYYNWVQEVSARSANKPARVTNILAAIVIMDSVQSGICWFEYILSQPYKNISNAISFT